MYWAPTPRERERWHALWLLVQGWTAVAVAEALGRDAHTIGRWVAVFGEDGPAAMAFEQSGGSPPDRGRYGLKSGCDIAWEGAPPSGILVGETTRCRRPAMRLPSECYQMQKTTLWVKRETLNRIYLTSPSHN